MDFGRVGFETRQDSSLCRKGRGSHPVLGSGLKQHEGQREKVGTGLRPVQQFRSKFNSFVIKYLLDPNIF